VYNRRLLLALNVVGNSTIDVVAESTLQVVQRKVNLLSDNQSIDAGVSPACSHARAREASAVPVGNIIRAAYRQHASVELMADSRFGFQLELQPDIAARIRARTFYFGLWRLRL